MDMRVYTLHQKPGRDLRPVGDGFSVLAMLLPPVWAIRQGLWLTLLGMAAALGLAAWWSPFAISPVFYGIALILAFEGGAVERTELWLCGWRECGLVEARSPEGAEEVFLTGGNLT